MKTAVKNLIRKAVLISSPYSFCDTLTSSNQYKRATLLLKLLRLNPHQDSPKNWDTIRMLALLLQTTKPDDVVFDAGAEKYSQILFNLQRLGYKNLRGMNLAFESDFSKNGINFFRGDITKTGFENDSVHAITCQSVIEHGVPLEDFFKESARILKPNSILTISTDYFETPVETNGVSFYGVPVKIFDKKQIQELLKIAKKHGFKLLCIGEPYLDTPRKIVYWEKVGIRYTFILLSFRKN